MILKIILGTECSEFSDKETTLDFKAKKYGKMNISNGWC